MISVSTINKAVGDALRKARLERGLSDFEAAAMCGMSEAEWSACEVGEQRLSASGIFNVTRAFGLPVSDLFAALRPGDRPFTGDHLPGPG